MMIFGTVVIQKKQIIGTPPVSIFQMCDSHKRCRKTNSGLG